MPRNIAIIGAGFGDEGKGKMVSYLCSTLSNPLVIRYCGGQQAAHHVMINDKLEHVFSNFGSGTLQGIDTYWSKYCTVDPVGILNELDVLLSKGIGCFKLHIDSQCPITTPYEKFYNKTLDSINKHGSCEVGIGTTHQRELNHYSLLASDLLYPSVLKIKMDMIGKYYEELLPITYWKEVGIRDFLLDCERLINISKVEIVNRNFFERYSDYIFEGSQGLLLDPKIGFFPHVTRSNTGTKNIIDMDFYPEVFLVTRAYQTRHGNGPMTNENIPHNIKVNPYERNLDTGCQGVFRRSILDLDLLRYAISKDHYIRNVNFNLVITCMDLMEEYSFTLNGIKVSCHNEKSFVDAIKDILMAKNIFLSRNPFPELETYKP